MTRSTPILSRAEAAAYAAPFTDASYKAAVRAFPDMLPTTPNAPGAQLSREARNWWRDEWRGESYMAVGVHDLVVTRASMGELCGIINGCPPPMQVDGGHFVQEGGAPVAAAALHAFAHSALTL